MTTKILHFPAKDQIAYHLSQHSLLKELCLTDKIIEVVAEFFADSDRSLGSTKIRVFTLLHDLKRELPEEQLTLMHTHLLKVLQELPKMEDSDFSQCGTSHEEKRVQNILELPVKGCKQCKKELANLGIEWTSSFEDTSLLVEAKLPTSWTVYEYPSDLDKRNLGILDYTGASKAIIWMRLGWNSQDLLVSTDTKVFDSEVERQFHAFLAKYKCILHSAINSESQSKMEQLWDQLHEFTLEHPEFADQIPEKEAFCLTEESSNLLPMTTNEKKKKPSCIIQ